MNTDAVYVAELCNEDGSIEFYWMDSRIWMVIQEMGKYIKKNYPYAGVTVEECGLNGFELMITYDDENDETITRTLFSVNRMRI